MLTANISLYIRLNIISHSYTYYVISRQGCRGYGNSHRIPIWVGMGIDFSLWELPHVGILSEFPQKSCRNGMGIKIPFTTLYISVTTLFLTYPNNEMYQLMYYIWGNYFIILKCYGNSHRNPVGMGWEWEWKFTSHGNSVNQGSCLANGCRGSEQKHKFFQHKFY